jgi:hypothetical protein
MNDDRGGFFSNVTGLLVAAFLGLCFWPMLLPLAGTGANYTKIVPLNWILEIVWLVFLVYAFRWLRRR